ncbi:MAG TPA: SuhR protein [Thermoanaerobaculia bacterium]|nr:SuhR protein [Thermoanaerobaculia bacterium]
MSVPLTEVPTAPDGPRECDIIMKGGITSGVVYPLAIVELAETYRFRNIGGTSAGAIAAALTAAAELGRNEPGGGFSKLKELPDILGDKLLSLFQPSPEARPVFEVLLASIGDGGLTTKAFRAILKIIRSQPIAFLLLAAVVLLLGWGIVGTGGAGFGFVLGWSFFVILALLAGLAGAVTAFALRAWKALNANGFGLCNGQDQTLKGELPLTPWLGGLVNSTAGRDPNGPPLTFGDLWGEGDRQAQEDDASLRKINLEVMTTNVTHGMPRRLPLSSHDFFFHPAELERYFPQTVIRWMIDHPYVPEDEAERDLLRRITKETPYRPLPAPADLPVLVPARMSLSFPLLISAVPLYSIDWSRKSNQLARREKRVPELERCWFSDGGIGSNFPVHFFDGLLPSQPTFGLNLRPFHPDFPRDPDESKNVRFPSASGQEVLPTFTPIPNALGFLATIITTMQNWVDNTQMRLPGYRDRVVHVHLDKEEGGLNLKMPTDRIKTLARRGKEAGRTLAGFNWNAHRWTRFRTAMPQLQHKLERMDAVYKSGFRNFLVAYDSKQKPYERPDAWKDFAIEGTDALMKVSETWAEHPKYKFTDKTPHPEPELRIGPKR